MPGEEPEEEIPDHLDQVTYEPPSKNEPVGLNLVSNWDKKPGYLNKLEGGEGNDTLTGIGEGGVYYLGYEGDDIMKGGPGLSVFVGGEGFVQITGGSYRNSYFLPEGYGFDTITSFAEGKDLIYTINREIAAIDLTIVSNISGGAYTLYGNDLLVVVTGVVGMLEIDTLPMGEMF